MGEVIVLAVGPGRLDFPPQFSQAGGFAWFILTAASRWCGLDCLDTIKLQILFLHY